VNILRNTLGTWWRFWKLDENALGTKKRKKGKVNSWNRRCSMKFLRIDWRIHINTCLTFLSMLDQMKITLFQSLCHTKASFANTNKVLERGPCHCINYILILIFYKMPRCYIINIIFNWNWSYSILVNGLCCWFN
jgi:hypothetical protein